MAMNVSELPIELSAGELETRYIELGEMAIRWAKVPAGGDMTPLLVGLPGDRCPSPHWGVVLDGEIDITHSDGRIEHVTPGQLYYWPAGHTGSTSTGITFVEVGPVGPMQEFGTNAKRILGVT
jgi:hypothetical protein